MAAANLDPMSYFTCDHNQPVTVPDALVDGPAAAGATCYSVTVFTMRWREIRDFYVEILGSKVLSERAGRYCELEVGGLPICLRQCEHGEVVSYFHLYISLKNRDSVLNELRRRGIVVTTVGPYTNFRDPEGRVIKLSDEKTIIG